MDLIVDIPSLMIETCRCNKLLPKNKLVSWTSGNVSGRFEKAMAIKPSGIDYEKLQPYWMSVMSLRGEVWPDGFWDEDCTEEFQTESPMLGNPSVDTPTHLYIYKNLPEVNGVCHTHSPYATAWAVSGRGLPCTLTAMADEFGEGIYCTEDVQYGGSIGLSDYALHRLKASGAILLRNHGVLTVGKTPEEAVKKAVMLEDCAKTLFYAQILKSIPSTDKLIALPVPEIEKAYERYHTAYGQKGEK